jgi:hypothetical protein
VMAALAMKADARPPSVTEFLTALRLPHGPRPSDAETAQPRPRDSQPSDTDSRRSHPTPPRSTGGSAWAWVILGLLLAVCWFGWQRWARDRKLPAPRPSAATSPAPTGNGGLNPLPPPPPLGGLNPTARPLGPVEGVPSGPGSGAPTEVRPVPPLPTLGAPPDRRPVPPAPPLGASAGSATPAPTILGVTADERPAPPSTPIGPHGSAPRESGSPPLGASAR